MKFGLRSILKDSSEVWVEEHAQIKWCFINNFATRFKWAQADATNIDLEMLKLVSDEDGHKLLQPIKDLKIKRVAFQMDKFKVPGPYGFGAAFF